MSQKNVMIYLAGRVSTLFVLLAFQVLVVRFLSVREYGQFALVFAIATLMQTVVSFGIPRLIPRLLADVGMGLTYSRARRLVRWLIAIRLGGTFSLMAVTLLATRLLGLADPVGPELLIGGGLFI